MQTRYLAWMGLAAALWIAAASGPAQGQQKPVRLLLVLLGSPGSHDVEKTPPFLEKAIQGVGGIEVTRLAPPVGKQGDGAHLARLAEIKPGDYDVIAFYTVGQRLSPEQEAALTAFVEQGGGIVAIHGASASFGNSDAWFRLIGCRFAGHAPGTFTLPVTIVDRSHPITRGLSDFDIVDEEYTHRFPEGVDRHVIARFKQRPPGSKEQNGNNDAVWTLTRGKGRVVYTALGHGDDAWKNPAWQKLVIQSILWAAGQPREVKIP